MKKFILLFTFFLFMGCANKANIEFQTWPYGKYKVEYEKGLVLMNEEVIKIMLNFERKTLARFFMTNTYEGLDIYILSNKHTIEGDAILIEKPKIYFIRGQSMSTSYGDMDDKYITIKKNKNRILLSGKLVSNKMKIGGVIFANVIFSCKNLKLQEVSSISEMLEFDKYNKEILDENFPEFYSE